MVLDDAPVAAPQGQPQAVRQQANLFEGHPAPNFTGTLNPHTTSIRPRLTVSVTAQCCPPVSQAIFRVYEQLSRRTL